HRADIGIRGFGPTREAAFEQAAQAAMGVITDLATVRAEQMIPVSCEAPDDELLLADWLNALVYQMAQQNMLFCSFKVRITGHRLTATAWGEKVDRTRHQPAAEIKAATYAELRVRPTQDGGWVAQCVVDV